MRERPARILFQALFQVVVGSGWSGLLPPVWGLATKKSAWLWRGRRGRWTGPPDVPGAPSTVRILPKLIVKAPPPTLLVLCPTHGCILRTGWGAATLLEPTLFQWPTVVLQEKKWHRAQTNFPIVYNAKINYCVFFNVVVFLFIEQC